MANPVGPKIKSMGVDKREIAEDLAEDMMRMGKQRRERSGDAGFEDGRRALEPRTAALEAGQDRERDFPQSRERGSVALPIPLFWF